MDFKSVLNNPFGNYFELIEWFKTFPMDDETIKKMIKSKSGLKI